MKVIVNKLFLNDYIPVKDIYIFFSFVLLPFFLYFFFLFVLYELSLGYFMPVYTYSSYIRFLDRDCQSVQ